MLFKPLPASRELAKAYANWRGPSAKPTVGGKCRWAARALPLAVDSDHRDGARGQVGGSRGVPNGGLEAMEQILEDASAPAWLKRRGTRTGGWRSSSGTAGRYDMAADQLARRSRVLHDHGLELFLFYLSFAGVP